MGDVVTDISGEITGANKTARAAGEAAMAQERAMIEGVGFARQGLEAGQAAGQQAIAAANSPQELAALTQALERQGSALDRQEKLFQSIDPAIMEASKQAFQLLQGQEAKSLAPLKASRQRQRQKLMDRLREQLGPGAETSTAGIQALNQFDQQTSEQLSGAQERSIGNLFGMGLQGEQAKLGRGQLINQGIGQTANIGGMFGQSAGRAAQTALAAGGLEQQGFGNLTQAQFNRAGGAGAKFVKSQLQGQARQAQHSQAMGGAMSMFSKGGGGGGAQGGGNEAGKQIGGGL
jgi:hypothetical protein